MSQVYHIDITCPVCDVEFSTPMYQTVLADPLFREGILNDTINRPICPHCKTTIIVTDASLLYHDAANRFAVWYEPVHDPLIDSFQEEGAKLRGMGYFAEAQRIKDWEEFKEVIAGRNTN